MVFLIESVATTTLLSPLVYLDIVSCRRARNGIESSLRYLDRPLQQYADSHFRDCLDAGLLVPFDLVDADIVLAVTCLSYGRHGSVVLKGLVGGRRSGIGIDRQLIEPR